MARSGRSSPWFCTVVPWQTGDCRRRDPRLRRPSASDAGASIARLPGRRLWSSREPAPRRGRSIAAAATAQGEYRHDQGPPGLGRRRRSRPQGPRREGQGDQGSRGLRQGCGRSSRGSWSSTPRPRASRTRFAYLVKPKGANPEAVKALLAKQPRSRSTRRTASSFPTCTAMHQDQTLVIKSSDPVNHNVRFAAFTNAAVQPDPRAQRAGRASSSSPSGGRSRSPAIFIPG